MDIFINQSIKAVEVQCSEYVISKLQDWNLFMYQMCFSRELFVHYKTFFKLLIGQKYLHTDASITLRKRDPFIFQIKIDFSKPLQWEQSH